MIDDLRRMSRRTVSAAQSPERGRRLGERRSLPQRPCCRRSPESLRRRSDGESAWVCTRREQSRCGEVSKAAQRRGAEAVWSLMPILWRQHGCRMGGMSDVAGQTGAREALV